jgi:transmembrane sensor
VLADGSSLDLNADSQARVTLSFWSRHIALERDEMLLDVARDTHRPLEVEVAGTRLRDIGTRFNVHLHGEQIVTTVLEGAVEVHGQNGQPHILLAGQKLRFSAHQLGVPEPVQTADATAWLQGRWQFQDTPLREVIDELNHYRATPVALTSPALGELKVSGTFRCDDHAGLLRAVQTLFDLQVSQQNDRTVLSQRTQ